MVAIPAARAAAITRSRLMMRTSPRSENGSRIYTRAYTAMNRTAPIFAVPRKRAEVSFALQPNRIGLPLHHAHHAAGTRLAVEMPGKEFTAIRIQFDQNVA